LVSKAIDACFSEVGKNLAQTQSFSLPFPTSVGYFILKSKQVITHLGDKRIAQTPP